MFFFVVGCLYIKQSSHNATGCKKKRFLRKYACNMAIISITFGMLFFFLPHRACSSTLSTHTLEKEKKKKLKVGYVLSSLHMPYLCGWKHGHRMGQLNDEQVYWEPIQPHYRRQVAPYNDVGHIAWIHRFMIGSDVRVKCEKVTRRERKKPVDQRNRNREIKECERVNEENRAKKENPIL